MNIKLAPFMALIAAILFGSQAFAASYPTYNLFRGDGTYTPSITVSPTGGDYQLNFGGSFNGSTVTVYQTISGTTTTLGTYSSVPGSAPCFTIPQGANIQAVVTAATPSTLTAVLGGLGSGGCGSGGGTAGNPTATASDTAVNGVATTYMRSDAAPAIQKSSATQFGLVKVDGTTITATGGVISASSGSGTVTSVATGAGLTGGPVTTTGTISTTFAIRAVTGTTDTVLSTDAAKLVTYSNAAAIAVTLPQATGSFGAGFATTVQNLGAGLVTITPTTSTVNGAATLTIPTNTGCDLVSDGTNWQVTACTALPAKFNLANASNYSVGADVQALANKWYNTQPGPTGTGIAAGATTTYFQSFTIDKAATIDTIGARTATVDAAGHWRGGIYLEDTTTHRPTGSALCTTADIALTSGSNNGACAAAIPAAGRVWIAYQTDSATGAIMASSAGSYNGTHVGVTTQTNLSGSGSVGATAYTVNSTTYGTFPSFPASTLSEASSTANVNLEVQIHINTVP